MKKYVVVVLFYILRCSGKELRSHKVFEDISDDDYVYIDPEWATEGVHYNNQVNSTLDRIVNRYYCNTNYSQQESQLILYGAKGWNFPNQDVNLTLTYPAAGARRYKYMITGFRVILQVDKPDGRGFIINGGVLQETITLSFIYSNLTMLSYKFWLVGVPITDDDEIIANALILC